MAWQSITASTAINTHSGYHIPFFPSPEAHDFHHLRFNVNYGVMGWLDYLHGTDSSFRSSEQYQRHKTYFSVDSYQPVSIRSRAVGPELCDGQTATAQ